MSNVLPVTGLRLTARAPCSVLRSPGRISSDAIGAFLPLRVLQLHGIGNAVAIIRDYCSSKKKDGNGGITFIK